MNGVIDHELIHTDLPLFHQPVGCSFQMVELAQSTQEYAIALDEALEGLVAAQQALQDLQASALLTHAGRQCIEQRVDTCAALMTAIQAQLLSLSDDLHAQLGQWAVYRASLSSSS